MTKFLKNGGVKLIGEGYDLSQVIGPVGFSRYEEIFHDFSPVYIPANLSGNSTSVKYQFNQDDYYRIEDIFINFTLTNSSATESPTFFNPNLLFEKVELTCNNVKIELSKEQLFLSMSNFLKDSTIDDRPLKRLLVCSETSTYNGENVAVSSSKQFSISLCNMYPFLKNMIPNQPIYSLEVKITFAINTNSAALNNTFVKSNTTSNAYGSNLSASDIKLKFCINRITDNRLMKHVNTIVLLQPAFDIRTYSQSWNTPLTDKLSIDLNSVFNHREKIVGLGLYIYPNGLNTAFNDADACKYYSSGNYISHKLISRSKTMYDLSSTVCSTNERLRYVSEFHKRRFSHYLPVECLDDSTNLSKFLIAPYYVDLQNLKLEDNDDFVISSYNNMSKVDEVVFYCEQALSTSCTIVCYLEYITLLNVVNTKTLQLQLIGN